MKECSGFIRAEDCPHGNDCPYLHGRANRESCAIEIVKNTGGDRHKWRWKTRICKSFEILGRCRYGKECAFAHGKAELTAHCPLAEPEKSHSSRLVVQAELRGHGTLAEPEKGNSSWSILDSEPDPRLLSEKELRVLERIQQKRTATIKKINKIYGDWIDDTQDLDERQ